MGQNKFEYSLVVVNQIQNIRDFFIQLQQVISLQKQSLTPHQEKDTESFLSTIYSLIDNLSDLILCNNDFISQTISKLNLQNHYKKIIEYNFRDIFVKFVLEYFCEGYRNKVLSFIDKNGIQKFIEKLKIDFLKVCADKPFAFKAPTDRFFKVLLETISEQNFLSQSAEQQRAIISNAFRQLNPITIFHPSLYNVAVYLYYSLTSISFFQDPENLLAPEAKDSFLLLNTNKKITTISNFSSVFINYLQDAIISYFSDFPQEIFVIQITAINAFFTKHQSLLQKFYEEIGPNLTDEQKKQILLQLQESKKSFKEELTTLAPKCILRQDDVDNYVIAFPFQNKLVIRDSVSIERAYQDLINSIAPPAQKIRRRKHGDAQIFFQNLLNSLRAYDNLFASEEKIFKEFPLDYSKISSDRLIVIFTTYINQLNKTQNNLTTPVFTHPDFSQAYISIVVKAFDLALQELTSTDDEINYAAPSFKNTLLTVCKEKIADLVSDNVELAKANSDRFTEVLTSSFNSINFDAPDAINTLKKVIVRNFNGANFVYISHPALYFFALDALLFLCLIKDFQTDNSERLVLSAIKNIFLGEQFSDPFLRKNNIADLNKLIEHLKKIIVTAIDNFYQDFQDTDFVKTEKHKQRLLNDLTTFYNNEIAWTKTLAAEKDYSRKELVEIIDRLENFHQQMLIKHENLKTCGFSSPRFYLHNFEKPFTNSAKILELTNNIKVIIEAFKKKLDSIPNEEKSAEKIPVIPPPASPESIPNPTVIHDKFSSFWFGIKLAIFILGMITAAIGAMLLLFAATAFMPSCCLISMLAATIAVSLSSLMIASFAVGGVMASAGLLVSLVSLVSFFSPFGKGENASKNLVLAPVASTT